jgi:uncharacterized membrane protein
MMGFNEFGSRGFGGVMGFGGMGLIAVIGGLFMFLLFICLIVLIIRALVWGPRYRRMGGMGYRMHGMHGHDMEHDMDEDEAMQVLRHRFAAGEISKEEYEDRLKTLKGTP